MPSTASRARPTVTRRQNKSLPRTPRQPNHLLTRRLSGEPFPHPTPAILESEGGVHPARDFSPAAPLAKGQIPHANLRQATPSQPAQRAALYRSDNRSEEHTSE